MNIEQDRLGIPDTDYEAEVTIPSSEFQRICRDLSILGDTGIS
jgi:proliferating cell nuclear antigen